jgi:hypothetical protein
MFDIIDIGGSFIKIFNSDTQHIKRINLENTNIINLKKIKDLILSNIDSKSEKIYLSCQMHGFVLYNNDKNITEFITWKTKSTRNYIKEIISNEEFKNITGLDCRNDLPINNIYDYFIKNNINNTTIYVKNISEAILDYDLSNTHITMACGNGFLDINNNTYHDKFIKLFYDKFKINLNFDNPINNIIINGHFIKNNKPIPVYCGIGDFQASLVGINHNELYINMATGSQMAILSDKLEFTKYTNYRSFFKNKTLKCITHIPSGRFLNIFLNTFDDLFIFDLSVDDIINSDLIIDTNIFDGNISITNINFNNFTKKNIIASIFRSYLDQYIYIYNNYFIDNNINKIILSGGIAKKIFFIKEYFELKLKKKIYMKNNCDDDSINGLLYIINNEL